MSEFRNRDSKVEAQLTWLEDLLIEWGREFMAALYAAGRLLRQLAGFLRG